MHIRQIVFVIIFATINLSCAGSSEHMGERLGKSIRKGIEGASKNLSSGLDGASQNLANGLGEASQNISSAIAEGSTNLGSAANGLADGIEKGAEKFGTQATQNLIDGLAPIAKVYVAYTVVKGAADVSKDLYNYAYPSLEKVAREEAAKETIATISTRRNFRSCLMNNATAPRNQFGIPKSCEDCGKNFAMAAGRGAFKEMVETFRETYNQ